MQYTVYSIQSIERKVSLMPTAAVNHAPIVLPTVQDAVTERLRHLILSNQLQPGQRLVQTELAEMLGVSRTPIRDALARLAHEGLVTLSARHGASVVRFSALELEELFAVRTALESYAASLAAERISEAELEQLDLLLTAMVDAFSRNDLEELLSAHQRFHSAIYAAARREQLAGLIIRTLAQADVYQRMALTMGRGAGDPVAEHRDLLAALRRRDAAASGASMRLHLELTAAELGQIFAGSKA